MNLVVDGVENPVPFEPGMPLGVVLERVDSYLSTRKRMMVSVCIDGHGLSPEELGRESARTVDAVQTIQVSSEPAATLADATLSEVEEHLPALSQTVKELATLFQQDKVAEGLEGCKRVTEIWMEIVARERRAAGALQLNLDELEVDGKPINEHHVELNEFLQEALQAMERSDYLLLGDLLEHELAPRLDTELEIVNELRKVVRTELT
jgi:hypothetical protein